ncbi:MAG TPA: hypothetical protein VFF11_13415 [Candidatus Binatia bacterium]|nr:hypothetical protein [Candidatus Binatia bacterium]
MAKALRRPASAADFPFRLMRGLLCLPFQHARSGFRSCRDGRRLKPLLQAIIARTGKFV